MISFLILGPSEIFFGNQSNFEFEYIDFIIHFVILSLIIGVAISSLISLFPEKINMTLNRIILALGICSYIQDMFMNIKLSEVDGSPMNWDSLGNFPFINLFIWIAIFAAVIVLTFIFKKHIKKILVYTSGVLCVMQLVAVVSLIVTPSENHKSSGLQISGDEQFEVSEDNIIMFILDTFGNTQFENTLKEYPECVNIFRDFTFYNNADCHYYCTFPSLTHMLTGNSFDFNTEDSVKWMNDSWSSEKAINFYNALKSKDYICNIYTSDIEYVYGSLNNLNSKFDNIKEGNDKEINHKTLILRLGKMSVYKYVPYVLKPYFEVINNQFNGIVSYKNFNMPITDNGEFYKTLKEKRLNISNSKKSFIIQHLLGTHTPYNIDENCNIVEESNINQVVKGLTVILNEYFEQLKELNVYDNSTIIVIADHGSWVGKDPQPIFFIKNKNERRDNMITNNAPISLDDMQATILSLLGNDYSDYGKSIFDWQENTERERTVYMRGNEDNYPKVKGSSYNVYYKYSYLKDKQELNDKISNAPDEILSATPWQ